MTNNINDTRIFQTPEEDLIVIHHAKWSPFQLIKVKKNAIIVKEGIWPDIKIWKYKGTRTKTSGLRLALASTSIKPFPKNHIIFDPKPLKDIMCADGYDVEIDHSYDIEIDDIEQYYNTRNPDANIENDIQSAITSYVAGKSYQDLKKLCEDKKTVADFTTTASNDFKRFFESYIRTVENKYGVKILSFRLQNVQPPEKIEKAMEARAEAMIKFETQQKEMDNEKELAKKQQEIELIQIKTQLEKLRQFVVMMAPVLSKIGMPQDKINEVLANYIMASIGDINTLNLVGANGNNMAQDGAVLQTVMNLLNRNNQNSGANTNQDNKNRNSHNQNIESEILDISSEFDSVLNDTNESGQRARRR